MILAALLDAGCEPAALQQALASLSLRAWQFKATRINTRGIASTHLTVEHEAELVTRTLSDVEAVVRGSALPEADSTLALRIFRA